MLLHKIIQRIRRWTKKRQLDSLWKSSPDHCQVDYGWIKLAYNRDQDFQELLYHVYAQEWHRNELAAFGSYVRPGDHAVDVGGNIGFVGKILADLVGPTGQVLSFEPNSVTFRKLQQTIELNQLKNVVAHNLGCGAESTEETLSWISDSSGHCRILPQASETSSPAMRHEAIKIIRLDDFLAGYQPRIAFLKVDTEGYEPAVLQGASERIKRDQPVIYIELAEDFKASANEARQILTSLDYTIPGLSNLQGFGNGSNFIALPKNWSPSS